MLPACWQTFTPAELVSNERVRAYQARHARSITTEQKAGLRREEKPQTLREWQAKEIIYGILHLYDNIHL